MTPLKVKLGIDISKIALPSGRSVLLLPSYLPPGICLAIGSSGKSVVNDSYTFMGQSNNGKLGLSSLHSFATIMFLKGLLLMCTAQYLLKEYLSVSLWSVLLCRETWDENLSLLRSVNYSVQTPLVLVGLTRAPSELCILKRVPV